MRCAMYRDLACDDRVIFSDSLISECLLTEPTYYIVMKGCVDCTACMKSSLQVYIPASVFMSDIADLIFYTTV